MTLVTDPFGILESLSLKLDTSLAPYYGRWGIRSARRGASPC